MDFCCLELICGLLLAAIALLVEALYKRANETTSLQADLTGLNLNLVNLTSALEDANATKERFKDKFMTLQRKYDQLVQLTSEKPNLGNADATYRRMIAELQELVVKYAREAREAKLEATKNRELSNALIVAGNVVSN